MSRVLALLLLLASAPALAQETVIPGEVALERLPERLRAEVREVCQDSTVGCALPEERVRCRAEVFGYLLAHLPQASRWLEVLDIESGSYAIEDLPRGGFRIDDRAGASASCERALVEDDLLVVIARGVLDVSILPRIHGTGVIVVRYSLEPETRDRLRCRAWVDFRVRSGALHLISRPFRRLLEQVLGEKLELLVRSAMGLAEAIERDPAGVFARLKADERIGPEDLEAFRRQFLFY